MAVREGTSERFWCVKQINIFQDLSETDVNALERITTFKQLKYSDTISTEGVYLLKEGRVKIYETPAEGEPVTLEVLEPGEIFGAVEWDDNAAHRNITAETLTEAVIGIVSAKNFQFFLKRKTHLAIPFKRPLLQRIRSAIDAVRCRLRISDIAKSKWASAKASNGIDLTKTRKPSRSGTTNPFPNIAFRSPASRLALLLRNYADAPKRNLTTIGQGSRRTLCKLSTKKISELIGCTAEHTEAVLNQFKAHEVLEKRYRRIQILDPWHLKKIAKARMASLPSKTIENQENTETYEQNEPLLATRPTDRR
ncbi:Crp/Fnr family transcriptional regulator [Candidatus Poribacteria bacterium]|nr:Crp/Fnr family transcriptional regulator [Candidatus Poribacteria bacterium]MYH83877.1 Crp/Fnr family transcriptional regulator [Candidatus Poribacteria bacterium]MYK93799.1 Crp/Fnr family transcriptional regulator [Candidatus Poribacteria bacterium]